MRFIQARGRAPILAIGAALALAACGGPSRPAPPAVHTVVIDQMAFSPKAVTANTGDVIEWVNKDFLRHSATDANGAFDVDLPAGATGKTVLRKAGSIKYSCRYHPGMTGTVSVADKG
jgi:plastocyanin